MDSYRLRNSRFSSYCYSRSFFPKGIMKYGLIGKSLGHSFSKSFFDDYFKKNEIDSSYSNIELESIQDFNSIDNSFSGFNVTIPYKESIIPFLDELSEEAKAIGAVNVVQFMDGKKIGHNTDAFGF